MHGSEKMWPYINELLTGLNMGHRMNLSEDMSSGDRAVKLYYPVSNPMFNLRLFEDGVCLRLGRSSSGGENLSWLLPCISTYEL